MKVKIFTNTLGSDNRMIVSMESGFVNSTLYDGPQLIDGGLTKLLDDVRKQNIITSMEFAKLTDEEMEQLL